MYTKQQYKVCVGPSSGRIRFVHEFAVDAYLKSNYVVIDTILTDKTKENTQFYKMLYPFMDVDVFQEHIKVWQKYCVDLVRGVYFVNSGQIVWHGS